MDGKRLSHQNIYCGDDTTIYLSNSDLNILYTEANIENYHIYLINTRLRPVFRKPTHTHTH